MTGLKQYLNRMIIFVLAVALLAALLAGRLMDAFNSNPLLNGIIGVVLLVGIAYSFRQVLGLRPEIDWLKAYRRGLGGVPERSPRLLGPLAAMIGDQDRDQPVRMTAISMRTLLDGVASRLDEGREISRYLTRLLIFLGLLGTFWGLLAVLAAIGNTIQSLSVEGNDITLMFDALKRGLQEPLSGMAIAFSSSLFGLAGSVILGFLDLQSGQAQNRFYNDLEDWLSTVAHVSRGGPSLGTGDEDGGGLAASAYLGALLEQTADNIDRLSRTLASDETARADTNEVLSNLSEGLAGLTDQMRSDQADLKKRTDAEILTQKTLERLTEQMANQEMGLDETSRQHLRNMDIGMKRFLDEQAKAQSHTAELLRSEMRILARTLAAALEQRAKSPRNEGEKP